MIASNQPALPDLLADAFWSRFNGFVHCVGPERELSLHVSEGEVRWASSAETAARPADLEALERQVLDVFSWRGARFEREPADIDPPSPGLKTPFHRLIASGIARIHDLELLERAVQPDDALRVEAVPNVPTEALRDLRDDTCAVLGTIRRGYREPADPAPADRPRLLQCLWELRLLGLTTNSGATGTPLGEILSSYLGPGPTLLRRPEPPPATPSLPPIAKLDPPPADTRAATPVFKLDEKDLASDTPVAGEQSASEWCGAGDTFSSENDPYRAITSYREAVRLAPKNVEYRLKLANSLALNPKWRKEAEDELLHAAELSPWDPRIQLSLGRIYKEARLIGRAKARFQAVLDMDSENAQAKRELRILAGGSGDANESGAKLSLLAKLRGLTQKPLTSVKKPEVEDEVGVVD